MTLLTRYRWDKDISYSEVKVLIVEQIVTNIENMEKEEIEKRDKLDSEREVAPLKKASDAKLIDTTALSIEQVVNRIVALANERI